MRVILMFVISCTNLFGKIGQTAPVVSNSPNSPYRQLSLLTQDVDKLKEELSILKTSHTSLEQKLEDTCRFIEKYDLIQKELQTNKNTSVEILERIKVLEIENEKLKNNNWNQEIEGLKTSYANLEQKLEDTCNFISDIGTEKYDLVQKELQASKNTFMEIIERIKALEAENEKLKNNNWKQAVEGLQTNYASLEQKLEDTCHFISDIGTEKYDLVQKELQANKSLSMQIEQKILTILTDWCKQAEGKIEADHASLEEVKRNLSESNDWISSKAFVAFKNENEQHVRELIDFFAEEKIEQFNQKLSEQDKKINQLSKGNENPVNLKHSFQKMEKKLGEFCKTTCDETIRQVNNRLQDLAHRMQSGFDALGCAKCVQHTIVSGESLSSIAQRYHTTPSQIRAVNGLQNSRGLRVGDTILIPKNQ